MYYSLVKRKDLVKYLWRFLDILLAKICKLDLIVLHFKWYSLEYQHYVEKDEDYELYRADSFDRFCRRGSPDEENKRTGQATPPPIEKAEEGFKKMFILWFRIKKKSPLINQF